MGTKTSVAILATFFILTVIGTCVYLQSLMLIYFFMGVIAGAGLILLAAMKLVEYPAIEEEV